MIQLDFEGDYGRQYNARIRNLIPGYDAIQELGAAALAARLPSARRALVVGVGSGLELPGLLQALPAAQVTLVEPSAQMRGLCEGLLERSGSAGRVQWGPEHLPEAEPLADGPFEAVICHNVLHVLPPAQQRPLLDQLAAQVAPGGALLLSSYSEPDPEAMQPWLELAAARFRALGMDGATVEAVMTSRNTTVFSLDAQLLERRLLRAGLEAPTQLMQAACFRLWISGRPAQGQAPAEPATAAAAIEQLLAVVAQLRDPDGGCPWDLQQTHRSLAPYVLEEAHEVADAIHHGDDRHLAEELGDLLLQVVLHGQIASEQQRFNLRQIATGISAKLIRRHPHVFGGAEAATSAEAVKTTWEAIKAQERAERQAETASTSPLSDQLAGKVRGQPALAGAMTISKKAAAAGFEWDAMAGVWEKVHEELDELKEAVASGDTAHAQAELGDVLFTLVNVARWCGIDPEAGLAGTNRRFLDRFSRVEAALGGDLQGRSIGELEQLWRQAKAQIRAEANGPSAQSSGS
jgi:XTP/dITP diphosphohydrolase